MSSKKDKENKQKDNKIQDEDAYAPEQQDHDGLAYFSESPSAANGTGRPKSGNSGNRSKETDSVRQYISHISSIKEASREEMGELWERVKRGDRRAKDRIFELNLRLVIPIAKKFLYLGADILDLIEEGNLGLYHAVAKYDPSLGYRFSTYASYWIEQHIRRYVEESSKTIRIPPHAWTAMRKWQREYKDFQEKFGRKPEISEMSRILGWNESQIRSAMNTADIVAGLSSIDAPRSAGDEDGNTLEDILHGGPEDTPEHLMTETNKLEVLKDALGELDPREREILEARYGLFGDDPKTLNEIGKSMNLSRERVRQLEARALQALRRAAISLGLIEDNSKPVKIAASYAKKMPPGSRLEVLSMALKGNSKNRSSDLKILKIPRRKK